MAKRPTLYLLDANSLLHRAWHALPPLTSPDGTVVNAVFGVLNVVIKLVQEQKPDAFVAAWDTEAPTFRHEAYEEYKATREEKPDELYAQIPLIQEGLELLGIPSLELDGYEADDIIGTLAKQQAKKGWHVVIVTGDRDLLQLIDPNIEVMAFKRGVTNTVLYDAKEVDAQYGLTIDQFLEYKAMRGDPSDNIPGIKGIGEKTATSLLQKYKNLKSIFNAAHDDSSELKPSVRKKLLEAEDDMDDILDLVRIHTDVPIKHAPEKGALGVKDSEAMRAFLKRMDFHSLLRRLELKSAKKAVKKTKQTRSEIKTEKEGLLALKRLGKEKRLTIYISGADQNTLFGSSLDALALGSGTSVSIFTGECLLSKPFKAELQKLFSNPSVDKITHEAKLVMKALAGLGLEVREWQFDTMLAAYLVGAGERNHDLYQVAETFSGKRIDADSPLAEKAEAINLAAAALEKRLKDDDLLSILNDFELPLIPILYDMEEIGIKIDIPFLNKLSQALTKKKERLEKRMIKLAGREFNPASPIQLAEVLFEDLKLPKKGIKKGKTGYSTAASELAKLHGHHEIIENIEEYRELSKLLSTYIDVLPGLADKSKRIHTTYQQAVASTGRLSSTNPNLQNIPIRTEAGREIRKAFISERGFALLACDYSQIELRIAAALSKDKAMVQAFVDGKDIHTETAASIWGVSAEEVTKEQRRVAKAINFGILFGQGPVGLSQTAGISFSEAKEFIQAYFDTYPSLQTYLEETKAFAKKHGYSETYFGRRRSIPEISSRLPQVRAQGERMAINMPIQGTEADIIKLAMIEIQKQLGGISKKSRLLLQVHDELLFEVPTKEVEQVSRFAKEVMESVCKLDVPIIVETKQGKNWQEMKPLP